MYMGTYGSVHLSSNKVYTIRNILPGVLVCLTSCITILVGYNIYMHVSCTCIIQIKTGLTVNRLGCEMRQKT